MPFQIVGTAQNADRNITEATVWTGTIADTGTYRFKVVLGDGSKNLSGDGGTYLLMLTSDGVIYRGGPEEFEIGTATRAEIQTEEFIFASGAVVSFKVYSPNASETDVDVAASIWQDVGASSGAVATVDTVVDGIKIKTDLIGTAAAIQSEPVVENGVITQIVIGDDYLAANSRSFTWDVAAVSGFTVGTCTCSFGGTRSGTGWLVSGTVSDNLDGTWELSFDLSKDDTADLEPGEYEWSAEVASAAGVEITNVKSDRRRVQLVAKQT